MREKYPTLVELETISAERDIPIYEAFQGTMIGQFHVLAPSRQRYLDLLPDFSKTPERKTTADTAGIVGYIIEDAKTAVRWVTESWTGETLSENPEPTTASNESSLVQMVVIDNRQLVLTGDVGPDGLHEAATYAEALVGSLSPTFMQVPHHGSRTSSSTELLAAMGRYNEELVNAGIMLAGEGLHPSSRGKRIAFDGPSRTVVDGPFAETRELIAGFWMFQVASLEEAVEWVKRCPNPFDGESEIEIRQVFEAEDFGEEFTPELREREERLRAELEKRGLVA